MSENHELEEKPSKEQKLIQDQIGLDLEAVLRTDEGRRTVLWFLGLSEIFKSAYTGEADATNFRLGEQNVGLKLIARLEQISPIIVPTLLLEAARRKDDNKEGVHVLEEDGE